MKGMMFNPYLPGYEYIPDGEPHVFGDRVYVYGSHDSFGGYEYCQNDYVCWSAPVDNLSAWRYEGVIYTRVDDPANRDGDMLLFAPDVTRGSDGRYYLYYVLDQVGFVSVAVCDEPAGRFTFYGYVHYEDGTRLGEGREDEAQFDPGVYTEGAVTYLYTGFCMPDRTDRHGAMVTVLGEDMLTVRRAPRFIAPSKSYEQGTGFEGHAFFEAPSMRFTAGRYVFIYSSVLSHELCYAVGESPLGPFTFQGTIVSNCDLFIDSYKAPERTMYYGGNNHGSIIEIAGRWYVFYHRHTNGHNFSRQGCIEEIQVEADGRIPQVEMTSCGGKGSPLPGRGIYPAYIACQLYCHEEQVTVGAPGEWMDDRFPRITQDEPDGDTGRPYIANMLSGAAAGYKYFAMSRVERIAVTTRGSGVGYLAVHLRWDGEEVGRIPVGRSNEWKTYENEVRLPDGIAALYFTFEGEGRLSLRDFSLSVSA